jgi:hypothetical protein
MQIAKHALLLAFSTFFLALGAGAQTVDQIIQKHLDALGGKDKIGQIKSIYYESSMQIMGSDAMTKITILDGKGYKLESEANGQTLVQCYTDKAGWDINPYAGATTAEVMSGDQYKSGKELIFVASPLYDYAARGNKVELLGQQDSAYKIRVTTPDSTEFFYYLDPSTYLIKKTEQKGVMMGQEMQVTRVYSNYKKSDFGYVLPYSLQVTYGTEFSFTSTVTKVEFNKPVDPKIFDMPK